MDLLVSVIVPVFNTEKYIKSCIDSVIMQSYKHWELILIDDGSSDNSPSICDNYVNKDSRIRVVHKTNSGVSDSRNIALDMALGEYVIFLDSDDYWNDSEALERLVSVSKRYNLDIIRGEYISINGNGHKFSEQIIQHERLKYTGIIICSFDFLRYAINGEFYLVLCLIRTSILDGIRFESGRIFLEDMQFFSQILLQKLRCMYLPDIRFYAYRQHDGCISSKINIRKIKDAFDMCEFFHAIAFDATDKRVIQYFNYQSVRIYYTTLETLSIDGYYEHCREYIEKLQLYKLRKKVYRWIFENNVYVKSFVYFVSPLCGVFYFRLKHSVSKVKNRFFYNKKEKNILSF